MKKKKTKFIDKNFLAVKYAKSDSNFSTIHIEHPITETENELFNILEQFAKIRNELHEIRHNIDYMKGLVHEKSLHYNDKEVRSKIEDRIHESLKWSSKIHSSIKQVQTECEQPTTKNVTLQVRNIQLNLIKNDYFIIYNDLVSFIEGYETKLKNIKKREALIISNNGTVTIQETDNLINETPSSMFVENILEDTQKAKMQLREIMNRHHELEKLENSLKEISELFHQISSLVVEQGSLIQVVEYHAEQASANVDKAADNVGKARDLQLKALKKKTCILIWITGILAFLFILILIT